MFEDELPECPTLENNGMLIEGAYLSGKLDAIEEMHGHMLFAVQGGIEERLLNIAGKHVQYLDPAGGPASRL